MADYRLSVRVLSRRNRSSVGAAAYRGGAQYLDERTGRLHDYTSRDDVLHSEMLAPSNAPKWALDPERLFNAAERAEGMRLIEKPQTRYRCVAREWQISLPHELTNEQNIQLAKAFSHELVDRYKIALQVSVHKPPEDGDDRNIHAHLLGTTRVIGPEGLGAKTRNLDDQKAGPTEVLYCRERWQHLQNKHLEKFRHAARVDCRSLRAQGITDRAPKQHLGPTGTAIKRKGGKAYWLPTRTIVDEEVDDPLDLMTDDELCGELTRARAQLIADSAAAMGAAQRRLDKRHADEARARIALQTARADLETYRKRHTVRRVLLDRFGLQWGVHRNLAGQVKGAETRYQQAFDKLAPDERIEALATARLERARAKLREFRKAHPLVAAAHDRWIIESRRLKDLEGDVQRARRAHIAAVRAVNFAARQLKAAESKHEQAQAPAAKTPSIQAIEDELELRRLTRELSHKLDQAETLALEDQAAPPPDLAIDEQAAVRTQDVDQTDVQVRVRTRERDLTTDQGDLQTQDADQTGDQASNAQVADMPVSSPATTEQPRPRRPRGRGRTIVKPSTPPAEEATAQSNAIVDKRERAPRPDLEFANIQDLYRTRKRFADVLDGITDPDHRNAAKQIRQDHGYDIHYTVAWLAERHPRAHKQVLAAIKGQELELQDRKRAATKPRDRGRGGPER